MAAPAKPAVTPQQGILAGALAAVLAAAAFIGPWEGDELSSYRDIVGVWTACMGVTDGVVPGKTYTRAQCEEMNRREVVKHLTGVAKCIRRPLTQPQWVAVGSWTYNVGVGAACGSTLVRKINAGASPSAWCPELLKWDRAGGRKVRGLTRRREAEYRMCMGDV